MTNLLKNKARWGIIPLAVGLLLVLAHNLLAVQYGNFQRISVAPDGTEANNASIHVILSPDGNVVLFGSSATNLLPVDGEGYRYYIFNRQSQTLQLTDIEIGYDLSSKVLFNYDGHYLAHNKDNSVWLRDLQTGADELISVNKNGSPTVWESILIGTSNDARYISFYSRSEDILDDMSNCNTLFIRDRATSTTICIPLLPGQTRPNIR